MYFAVQYWPWKEGLSGYLTFSLRSADLLDFMLNNVLAFSPASAAEAKNEMCTSMLDTDVLLWSVCSKLKDENCS